MSNYEIDNKQKISAGIMADDVARQILDALKGIRFGSVETVIHEGRVVQLERREKVRFDNLKEAPLSKWAALNRHEPEARHTN